MKDTKNRILKLRQDLKNPKHILTIENILKKYEKNEKYSLAGNERNAIYYIKQMTYNNEAKSKKNIERVNAHKIKNGWVRKVEFKHAPRTKLEDFEQLLKDCAIGDVKNVKNLFEIYKKPGKKEKKHIALLSAIKKRTYGNGNRG